MPSKYLKSLMNDIKLCQEYKVYIKLKKIYERKDGAVNSDSDRNNLCNDI